MSRHTIHSYRDRLVLLMRFLSAKRHCGIERLDLAAITAESVGQFLTSLERDRHNGIATRNARLAAIHTFARFLATERPEHLAVTQAILNIPFERGARSAPIEYLEQDEVEALLNAASECSPPRPPSRPSATLACSETAVNLPPGSARFQQKSSGGKTRLGRITKQGNTYLRTLLFQRARSAVTSAHRLTDRLSRWIVQLQARVGWYRTLVAVANKHARILWAILAKGERFNPSHVCPPQHRASHGGTVGTPVS